MIKVIEKVFRTLELLHPDRDLSLTYLAKQTQINKTTLCNIFRTLTELGYLENDGHGNYRLSAKFLQIGQPSPNKALVERISMEFCTALADKTKESAVIATLAEHQVRIIAQARFERTLMLSLSIYKNLSLWRSTSGRCLLAELTDNELTRLLSDVGCPGELWENANDRNAVVRLLTPIRRQKIAVMVNQKERITAFSVPFFDGEGMLCGTIGLTAPQFRLEDGTEEKIIQELHDCGRKLTLQNKNLNLTAKDWRKR